MDLPEATPPVNMFTVETSQRSVSSHNSVDDSITTSTDAVNSGSAGYQLVPYKPSPILPVFQEEKRSFRFAGKEWTVLQQWNDVGLAAVVWEAVSKCYLFVSLFTVAHAYIVSHIIDIIEGFHCTRSIIPELSKTSL